MGVAISKLRCLGWQHIGVEDMLSLPLSSGWLHFSLYYSLHIISSIEAGIPHLCSFGQIFDRLPTIFHMTLHILNLCFTNNLSKYGFHAKQQWIAVCPIETSAKQFGLELTLKRQSFTVRMVYLAIPASALSNGHLLPIKSENELLLSVSSIVSQQ